MKGYETTEGTSFIGRVNGVAAEDCDPVKRLRDAGAMIIGKTNMPEIGLGTTGFNAHFGTARNPYGINHYTGGASSGSAAVVAAGIVPIAIGLDGGGTLRIPSSLCGIIGLKATFKRIALDIQLAPRYVVSKRSP